MTSAITSGRGRLLFHRLDGNPILTVDRLPFAANAVFNPGAALVDGETVLLVRVEDLRGISTLHVARSSNGLSGWSIAPSALIEPDPSHPEEEWGCEDPRVTWLAERGEWAIAYTAFGRQGPLISLATTRDFVSVERLGPIMPADDKDAALFPRRIGGRWALIHRPSPLRGGSGMWISFSPDLRHWGDRTVLIPAREGSWWDAGKVGLGPPPLETPDGWLLMYHGVRVTAAGAIYRAGLALLDLADPRIVLRRSDEWVLAPHAAYERTGDIDQVIFPCGWILDEPSDRLLVYYGAADTVVGLAVATFSELMAYVRELPVSTAQAVSIRPS